MGHGDSDLFGEDHHNTLWNSHDETLFTFWTVLVFYTDMIIVFIFLFGAARLFY